MTVIWIVPYVGRCSAKCGSDGGSLARMPLTINPITTRATTITAGMSWRFEETFFAGASGSVLVGGSGSAPAAGGGGGSGRGIKVGSLPPASVMQ